ncbi:Cupredoxin [Chytriomyces sp. MP71]|nr:Cupredoxin [Chytriomyces sp. MP71]
MIAARFGLAVLALISIASIQGVSASPSSAARLAARRDLRSDRRDPAQTPQTFKVYPSTGHTVYLNWTASPVTINADGVAVPKFGINGKPAHLSSIDANVGDRVVLTYVNHLPYPSALHFHGLFQRGTPFMDGPVGITQCAIAPGKSYRYDFELQQTGDQHSWLNWLNQAHFF